MRFRTRIASMFGVAALALAVSAVAWANGAEFFAAQQDGPPVLYYFGNIKDSSGNVLDKLMITISVKNAGLNFPFRNDAPGHFRSPDVGKALKGIQKPIDPSQIEIKVTKAGYKVVKAPAVPTTLGAVNLGLFVLDPDPAAK